MSYSATQPSAVGTGQASARTRVAVAMVRRRERRVVMCILFGGYSFES